MRERAAAVAELEAVREDAAERDPRTGLYTGAYLERWTRGLGAGTLPIGLVLLRVFGVGELRGQYGLRAEMAALQGLREGISGLLHPTDRLVRIGREDFLVVLPSWPNERGAAPHRRGLRAGQRARPGAIPFVALPAVAAATVTRERPLPSWTRLVHEVACVERLRSSAQAAGGRAGSSRCRRVR